MAGLVNGGLWRWDETGAAPHNSGPAISPLFNINKEALKDDAIRWAVRHGTSKRYECDQCSGSDYEEDNKQDLRGFSASILPSAVFLPPFLPPPFFRCPFRYPVLAYLISFVDPFLLGLEGAVGWWCGPGELRGLQWTVCWVQG
jgi:hypothetical protein